MNLYTLSRILSCLSVVRGFRPPRLSYEEDRNKNTSAEDNFSWLKSDNRFDCVVFITTGWKFPTPIGMGIFVNNKTVVTSATVIEAHFTSNESDKDPGKKSTINNIKVYAIKNRWNKAKQYKLMTITTNLSNREEVWIKMGFNKKRSPIHDLVFLTVQEFVKKPPVEGRQPFYFDASFRSYFSNGFTFPDFQLNGEYFLPSSTSWNISMLEPHTYEDSYEEDCDEWIPRAWGRFVCLLNVDNLMALESGTPLFQHGEFRGIGSFTLRKGKESILVFTDFGLYKWLLKKKNTTMITRTTPKP